MEHSIPIVLGTGNFGHVYRGELVVPSSPSGGATRPTSKVVAVKRLNSELAINRENGFFYFFKLEASENEVFCCCSRPNSLYIYI